MNSEILADTHTHKQAKPKLAVCSRWHSKTVSHFFFLWREKGEIVSGGKDPDCLDGRGSSGRLMASPVTVYPSYHC